ncbi:MAG: hypothetical protein JST82_01995 [Bacteroidetes bacterium]|nr:hypothetical protein [Bacteroidota bacterium]
MTYRFTDIPDDEDEKPVKYNFNNRKYANVGKHYHRTPLFGYDYIDLDETEYSFQQQCLDNTDIVSYFMNLKKLSKLTINDLIDHSSHKEHIHFYNNPNAKIKELLKVVLKKENLRPEETPVVGQVGLYTSNKQASRSTGIKCPRIYFMVGPHAVLYILFYDPYHEINSGLV